MGALSLLAACVMLATASTSTSAGAHTLGPGQGAWQTDRAEAHGLSSTLLNKAAENIQKFASERYCLVVAKDGVVVSEHYFANNSESLCVLTLFLLRIAHDLA